MIFILKRRYDNHRVVSNVDAFDVQQNQFYILNPFNGLEYLEGLDYIHDVHIDWRWWGSRQFIDEIGVLCLDQKEMNSLLDLLNKENRINFINDCIINHDCIFDDDINKKFFYHHFLDHCDENRYILDENHYITVILRGEYLKDEHKIAKLAAIKSGILH